MARQRLRKAAEQLRYEGAEPPGVQPEHHLVRSAAVVLPVDEPFLEGAGDALKVRPGVPQASV